MEKGTHKFTIRYRPNGSFHLAVETDGWIVQSEDTAYNSVSFVQGGDGIKYFAATNHFEGQLPVNVVFTISTFSTEVI